MNYRKFIYRRHDWMADRLEEQFEKTKIEPFNGFAELLAKKNSLKEQSDKIFADAKTAGFAVPSKEWSKEWSEACRSACALVKQAESMNESLAAPYKGKHFVNIHVLVGYCPQTIPYYRQMIKELQKTFPEAKTADITLGQVSKSSCVQGFTLIMWSGEIGFEDLSSRNGAKDFYEANNCEYYW